MAEVADGLLISVALNALRWSAADELMSRSGGREPSAENLLDFVRGTFAKASIEECVGRYRLASTVDGRLFALPTHAGLQRSLLSPLHNAKAEFILGHHLSCIGLCGVVAEVLCVLRFDAAEVTCAGVSLDEATQRDLWGRTFERLFQSQRISALAALNLIDEPTRASLTSIASTRNKYMHIYGHDGQTEAEDAFNVYRAICEVTVAILGIDVVGTKFSLHPDILRLLRK